MLSLSDDQPALAPEHSQAASRMLPNCILSWCKKTRKKNAKIHP